MNNDTAKGKFEQVKGSVKQSVGEVFGNEELANSGAADQVKGAAQETWGKTKDAAHAVVSDVQARAEVRQAEAREQAAEVREDAHDHAHDVREKITSTAQNVKNAISNKLGEIKTDHKRSA